MKFTAQKESLLAGLNIVSKATGKNVIPILEYVLFNIQGNKLTLTGANLEVFISHDVEIQSEITKKIAIPHEGLSRLLSALPDVPLEFTIEELTKTINQKKVVYYTLHLKAGKGKYQLSAEPGEDFPEVKDEFAGEEFKLNSADLLPLLQKTVWSCAAEDARTYLTGVNFEVSKNQMICTATNTNVLSTVSLITDVDTDKTFIVPGRLLKTLQSLIFDDVVSLKFGTSNLSIKVNEATYFTARLVDEKYLDYRSVIPKEQPFKLIADKKELLGALKRIGNFANDQSHLLRFEILAGVLTLSAKDDIKGSASEEISGDYQGKDITMGFNVNFLTEALKKIDGDIVVMSLSDPTRCMVLKDQADEGTEGNLFLVMPMYLN